ETQSYLEHREKNHREERTNMMNNKVNWFSLCVLSLCSLCLCGSFSSAGEPIKVGIIGLDTSHAPAFTKIFNDPKAQPDVAGFRVVAAYPKGSPNIESSVKRVPQYTADVQKLGVDI